jgi:hypothetical protein
MNKPRIFVGSSMEGIDLANAIHQNLEHYAEVTTWTQGIFELSKSNISNLINSLGNFDFAIFVFLPDDITLIRGVEYSTVRDNVIFETGLFCGCLGIDKVYFLKPRNIPTLHLPTDLLGILAGEYDSERMDRNLVAATGPFCSQVRQRISSIISIANAKKSCYEDLLILSKYMSLNGWTAMGFQSIFKNVSQNLTEKRLMEIIEYFPNAIKNYQFDDGTKGVKIIAKP